MSVQLNLGNQIHIAVIGASRGIGFEFVSQLVATNQTQKLHALCRNPEKSLGLQKLMQKYPEKLFLYKLDVTQEEDIRNTANAIIKESESLHFMINCVGVLHNENGLQPEKRLEDITLDNLIKSFCINTFPTLLLAKYFSPCFKHEQKAIFACISARVSSIDDNRLGGWYSYRSSKTALNMIMKNISLEFKRTAKTTICLLLHPGTVATDLSAPFAKNAKKVFSPSQSVTHLIEVINSVQVEDTGKFFAWDGAQIPW